MSVKRKKESTSVTRKSAGRRKRSSGGRSFYDVMVNLVLPLMLIVIMLGAIGALAFIGYKGATKSDFFKVRSIVVTGNSKIDAKDVREVVEAKTADGLWSADLGAIKRAILDRFRYTKDAAVSRQLPDTVTVSIIERIPQAVIRMGDDDYWVDDDGVVLASVEKNDDLTGWFVMLGWDSAADDKPQTAQSERAKRENKDRVKLYARIREEANNLSVIDRLKWIDASNLQSVSAYLFDGGRVEAILGKDNFGARLSAATELTATEDRSITVDMTISPPVKSPRSATSKAGKPSPPKTDSERKSDSAKPAKPDASKEKTKKPDSSKKKN